MGYYLPIYHSGLKASRKKTEHFTKTSDLSNEFTFFSYQIPHMYLLTFFCLSKANGTALVRLLAFKHQE